MFKAVLQHCLDENKWKKWTFTVIGFIFFYGMYLRIKKLAQHNLWSDEYWQLTSMQGTFRQFLQKLPVYEFCSYLSGDHYLIFPFFKIFGFNKWGLALPHIIATVIGFYLLYVICRKFFKTPAGYIISFLIVSLNATMINHATEIRVYAVLPTLALANFLLSMELVDKKKDLSSGKKIFTGVFFVFTLWFHLYALFTLLFPITFALSTTIDTKTFKKSFFYVFKFMSIVLCVAMPLWLYSVFGPHLSREGAVYGFSTFMFIPDPILNLSGFVKAILGNLLGQKALYVLLGLAIMPFILPYKERNNQARMLTHLVFLPICMLLVIDIKHNYFFVQRQFIWTIPFFALFLGWAGDSLVCYLNERIISKRE